MKTTNKQTGRQWQAEQLKDRRDYRDTLIQRREDTDKKIAATEAQIHKLTQPAN